MSLEYRIGDVFERLAEIPDGSIDLIATSPPFLALRSYLPADHPDKHREIGSEATPAAFIDTLLALSAEWGRVLAPHGSLCVELGDTYSGSTAGGGDYQIREVAPGERATRREGFIANGIEPNMNQRKGRGWPLAKSLTGIPTLYPWSLAYGRNLLAGQESPAGQWRIRNVIVWARPNPPVGALGDKFRPATSYITVACRGAKRYFDLDAVRLPHQHPDATHTPGVTGVQPGNTERYRGALENNPAGAPPLDWHTDNHPEDGDWLWKLSTQPYSGSHYATFPMALPKRLIEAMCPLRVCVECGRPSERIAETTNALGEAAGRKSWRADPSNIGAGHVGDITRSISSAPTAERVTLGWTDCGHGSYRCRTCHVVVPLDYAIRQPRQGTSGETQVSDEAILGEPIQVANGSTEHAGRVRAVRNRVHGSTGREVLHPELFSEVGALRGTTTDRAGAIEPDGPTDAQGSQRGDVRAGVGSARLPGQTEERLDHGAPQGDAGTPGAAARTVGDRSSSKRNQDGQQDCEPGSGDKGEACGDGDLPALSGDVRGPLNGYVCPCGSREVEYVADHWRTGVVLDPFAGSGTTIEAAQAVGRHAIGFDLDARNAELAQQRVGMFLEVTA